MSRNDFAIFTEWVYPPIPMRQFDWAACRGNYEPGCPVGFGPTEKDAIIDLLEQEVERDNEI